MINIVELKPDQSDTVLNEGLDKLTILEDRDVYYHFRDNIFYKELDQFISGSDNKSASRIKSTANLSGGDKTRINHENNLIRSKFINKFEAVRQNYFLYNDKIHTYSIHNIKNPANVITIHQWENSELINDLESLAQLRRKGFFKIFFGSYKS